MSKFSTTAQVGKELRNNPNRIVIPGESWRGPRKYDFLGFADWISFLEGEGWWLTNGCLASDLNAHIIKAMANTELKRLWTERGFGSRFFVYPNRSDREEGNTDHGTVVFAPATKSKHKVDKGGK